MFACMNEYDVTVIKTSASVGKLTQSSRKEKSDDQDNSSAA